MTSLFLVTKNLLNPSFKNTKVLRNTDENNKSFYSYHFIPQHATNISMIHFTQREQMTKQSRLFQVIAFSHLSLHHFISSITASDVSSLIAKSYTVKQSFSFFSVFFFNAYDYYSIIIDVTIEFPVNVINNNKLIG